MQDRELFRQLLGLEKPWVISDMNVDLAGMKVEIVVECQKGSELPCPECGKLWKMYDHTEERKWRHLDTMQFQTIIRCKTPRVQCEEHGVKTVKVPWGEKKSRFTLLFERFVIEVLLSAQNQKKAGALLRLTWDEVHNIQCRAVERGLSRRAEENTAHIGVDEKSFLKGQSYATVVYDLDQSKVLDVGKDRKEESLALLINKMSEPQKKAVKAVAVDMWEPYRKALEAGLPNAQIVHDKFHIMKYISEAVDKVRRTENREMLKEGNGQLKGTKYLWLTNRVNWSERQQKTFKEMKVEELKVGRAWAMKEMFRQFWQYKYIKPARKFFDQWHSWATHSKLQPMAEVAKMINKHLGNILSFLKHRITNAVAEGINSKIQQVKASARGFRNFDNYRVAILFYCGKLSLYPQISL